MTPAIARKLNLDGVDGRSAPGFRRCAAPLAILVDARRSPHDGRTTKLLSAPAIFATYDINVTFNGAIRWASFRQNGNDQRFLAAGDLANLREISSRKESHLNRMS
jgi:hypothetical protein